DSQAMVRPFGQNRTRRTAGVSMVASTRPFSESQIKSFWAPALEELMLFRATASCLPSEEKATDAPLPRGALIDRITFPVSTLHRRTASPLSRPVVAKVFPSGEKAAA